MNRADKKSGPVVLVIDYGASNLRSVQKAFAKLGYEARVSGEAGDIAAADALVLPGQGAAKPTMEGLRERGLVEPVLHSSPKADPSSVCAWACRFYSTSRQRETRSASGSSRVQSSGCPKA